MNNALEKAREKVKEMREAGIEVKRLNPIEKLEQKPTPLNAIKAKCYECVGEDEVGWKETIRGCTSYSCPLYNFRSYK